MTYHRRGKSLSEALTLEHSEDGGLFISRINNASRKKGLKEGDKLLGATIDFEQLSKEDVLKVLQVMEPFDDKVKVLTRGNLSKSLGDLDQCGKKSPKTMLEDSYNKLYNTKIKRFMKDDMLGVGGGAVNGGLGATGSSKVSLKHDMGLPRLGVDFGRLKTYKYTSTSDDAKSDSDYYLATSPRQMNFDSNLNLPPLGLGGSSQSQHQVPGLKAEGPQFNTTDYHFSGTLPEGATLNAAGGLQQNLKLPYHERPDTGLNGNEISNTLEIEGPRISLPESGVNLNGGNIAGASVNARAPRLDIDRTKTNFKVPQFGMPDVDLHGPSMSGTEYEIETPRVRRTGEDLQNADFKYSKRLKTSAVDVDDPTGYAHSRKLHLSGRTPDIDMEMPDISSGGVKMPTIRPKIDLKSPHFDADASGGQLTGPNFGSTGTGLSGIETPEYGVKTPVIRGDIQAPDVNLSKKVGKGVSGKYKPPKFTMPKFDLPDIPVPDFEGDLRRPDVHFSSPNVKSGTFDPKMDLNFSGPSGKLKMPSTGKQGIDLDLPNMGLNAPKMEVKTPNVNIGSPKPKFKMPKIKIPKFGLRGSDIDVNAPDVNLRGPKADLEIPDVDVSGRSGKYQKPNLNLPDLDSRINPPDLHMPEGDLSTPELDLNSPRVDLDMPSGKFKMPELNAPDWDINAPSGKLKMPKFHIPSLKGPNIDGNLDGPDMDINAPKVNLRGPNADLDVDVKAPSGKFKMPNMNMPKFGLRGSDINVNAPDVNLRGPKADLEIPDVDISGRSGKFQKPSMNMPDLGGGINLPDLNMPKFNVKKPDLDIDAPGVDLDMPSGKLKMPKFNIPGFKGPKIDGGLDGPDMDINAPNIDIDGPNADLDVDVKAPSGKFKMPNFNLPDLDADVKGPSGKFKMPNMNMPDLGGGINLPDVNMPKFNVKKPDLDIDAPGVDLDMPSGKLKMPKFTIPNLKGPKIDGNLNGPDIDIDAPNVNLEGDLDIDAPSGKFKTPNVSMPNFKLSGPNIGGPKLDMKSPDWDISAPDLRGGVKGPGLKMPELDFKSPKLDMDSPKLNLDMPSGKMKMPKLNFSGTLPKGPNLDMNTGLKSPDWSLKSPKINAGIDAPDVNLPNMDMKAPKLDVNAPNVNIGSPKGKFKLPKFKLPSFNFPGLKGPEIDSPDVDINAPNVNLKGPNADLDVDVKAPSGKFKSPNLNWPKFGFSGPNIDGPKLDLKSPDLDISAPDLSGGLNAPDINMPKVDLKSPKFDINSPKLNLDMPTLAKPKAKLHGPDWDLNAPSGKLKMPKLNLSGTLPKGPNLDMNTDVNLKGPKIEGGINGPDMNLPEIDVNAPKVDINTPDFDIDSPKGKFKMPKLKMPKFNLPGIKTPEFDGNLDGPDVDINAPQVNLKGSKPDFEMPRVDFGHSYDKINLPHLKIPVVGFTCGDLDGPDIDLKTRDLNAKLPKGPNLKMNSDFNSPDVNIRAPHMKGGISSPKMGLPDIDIKSPKLDIDTPDVNIDLPDAKLKKHKIKKPKLPDVNFQGDVPNLDINGPSGKLKMPSLSTPDLSFSAPKSKTLDTNISVPKLKVPTIGTPDINLPDASLKRPKINMDANRPDLGVNGSLGRPDINLNAPQVRGGFNAPSFDINGPSGNMQVPQTDLDLSDKKFKFPSFKLPQFGSPDMNTTGSDIDFGASLRPARVDIAPPNVKASVPLELGGDITAPNIRAPNVDVQLPKAAVRKPQIKSPELNLDDASLNIKGPSPKQRRSDGTGMNLKMPDLDIDRDLRLHHSGTISYKDPQVDFTRSDLNIDDFTGKEHVLRARGSKLDLQGSHKLEKVNSPSRGHIDARETVQTRKVPSGDIIVYSNQNRTKQQEAKIKLPQFSQNNNIRVPESSDGYYVTVFPSHTENQKTSNRKYNTLGGMEFNSGDIELEVPGEKDVKGSTFFFSDLV